MGRPDVRLALSARVRPSPFFEATVGHDLRSATVYNHMLLPVAYEGVDGYSALTERVTVWDVGGERQVEITGPDSARFTQYLVTRDVTRIRPGQARYTLVCQEDGGILNDPVLLRLAPDHFWLSLADSDLLLWAKGVAHNSGFDVSLGEPDVSPVQVQGPRSPELMRSLFGDLVDQLAFYQFVEIDLEGVPLVVARTGWSGERGYEIFLRASEWGTWLWERLFAAGEPFGVAPGAPNNVRRIEAGLLSYGTDMDSSMNPFEMGLDKFVDLEATDDFIGMDALARVAEEGPGRQRIGLLIDDDPILDGPLRRWPVSVDDSEVGVVTSAAWSPALGRNIAFALMASDHARATADVTVLTPEGPRPAAATTLPFIGPRYR